jgi:hypothetical protein
LCVSANCDLQYYLFAFVCLQGVLSTIHIPPPLHITYYLRQSSCSLGTPVYITCVCLSVCLSVSRGASLFCCFVQGILLCPQTLAQSRRARLRRAFTDATSETVTYVKTVGPSLYSTLALPASCLSYHAFILSFCPFSQKPLCC